jgi:hypothetical protein
VDAQTATIVVAIAGAVPGTLAAWVAWLSLRASQHNADALADTKTTLQKQGDQMDGHLKALIAAKEEIAHIAGEKAGAAEAQSAGVALPR